MEKKQYTPGEALEVLGNGLYEIRLLTTYPYSMYTKDLSTLNQKLKSKLDERSNAFFTLNKLDPALYSRIQSESFRNDKKMPTTSDNDVIAYSWLLVDLDPVRRSEISSSKEEKEAAHALSGKIYNALQKFGVPKNSIIAADSGNGYHLLIKVDFAVDEESRKIVENFLKTLDKLFSTSKVLVDTANFNPARICKLYGTVAHKGMSTQERPHRKSNLLLVPETLEVCDRAVIEKISQMFAQQETETKRRSSYRGTSPEEFDANQFIDEFVAKHHIQIIEEVKNGENRRMILNECPFDANHKHDAMIGVMDNKPFFFCFHNSCRQNHWREFRLLYEPNFERDREDKKREWEAEHRDYQKGYSGGKRPGRLNPIDLVDKVATKPVEEEQENQEPPYDKNKDFFNIMDGIRALQANHGKVQGYPTGFANLDAELEDGVLGKGDLSIVSGDSGSGKSTFVNQLMLNMIQNGVKSAIYSGELVMDKLTKWIVRQACGRRFMSESASGKTYISDSRMEMIGKWAGDKIKIYNNEKGQKVSVLIEKLVQCIEKENLGLVIIDNLMSIDKDEMGNDFGVEGQIIKAGIKIAQKYRIHVIVIVHPRKTDGYMRKNDINGDKAITNLASNIFIMHRNNEDFRRAYYKFKTGKEWREGCSTEFDTEEGSQYGNILEIIKNRDYGSAQDKKIPYYFDKESRRFLETEEELENPLKQKLYGWEPDIFDTLSSSGYPGEDLPFE